MAGAAQKGDALGWVLAFGPCAVPVLVGLWFWITAAAVRLQRVRTLRCVDRLRGGALFRKIQSLRLVAITACLGGRNACFVRAVFELKQWPA